MRIPRIYLPLSLALGLQLVLTDKKINHYLLNVLRLECGAILVVFDGKGASFQAKVVAVQGKQATLLLEKMLVTATESPLQLHLGQGISRGERMDYTIQKSTELGVTDITPIFTERTEVKLRAERLEKRLLHWQQVAISACEQSGRTRLPVIHPPCSVQDWLAHTQADQKWVCDTESDAFLPTDSVTPQSVAFLIGPEGGLTDKEVSTAKEHSFQALSLGPRVLRTETAGVVALTLFQATWGDLNG